jgi:hypothetical protein
MAVLVVAIIIMVTLTFLYQKDNSSYNQNNTLYPFSGTVRSDQSSVVLNNASGTPQIDCSAVGGKINIVGAWVEVSDSFSQCSGLSDDVLNLTCGLKGTRVPCKQDNDCGAGMNCAGGLCTPSMCSLSDDKGNFLPSSCSCGGNYCPIQPGAACKSFADCKDPEGTVMSCISNGGDNTSGTCQVNPGQTCMAPDQYIGKFCASYPLCSNVDTSLKDKTVNVVNKVCSSKSPGGCRPRVSSSYLAAKCDGQKTCDINFNPADRNSGFGPMPCNNVDQTLLPITPGQGGSYNQGYYVHGLYTCIL